MALLILLIIFVTPAVVGFIGGMIGNTATVNRSITMNSRNENQQFFDSEHETQSWEPTPLSLPKMDMAETKTTLPEQIQPANHEVSSLPPEVEKEIKLLMNEIGVDVRGIEPIPSEPIENRNDFDNYNQTQELGWEEHDIDRMLESINDSDVPPPIPDNLIKFPDQNSQLPWKEYNAICRVYGSEFADKITTTPSLGATDNDSDVMMGRLSCSDEGTILLNYSNTSIPIRGVGITQDLDGEVVLVKGFFIESNVFMVEDIIVRSEEKQEAQ